MSFLTGIPQFVLFIVERNLKVAKARTVTTFRIYSIKFLIMKKKPDPH